MNDLKMSVNDVVEEMDYITGVTRSARTTTIHTGFASGTTRAFKNERGGTFGSISPLGLHRIMFIFSRERGKSGGRYRNYFPAMRYHQILTGIVDAVRIDKTCFSHPGSFFWKRGFYTEKDGSQKKIIMIYPNMVDRPGIEDLFNILKTSTIEKIRAIDGLDWGNRTHADTEQQPVHRPFLETHKRI